MVKVDSLVNQNKNGANSLRKVKEKPLRMLVTLLLGNNLVNISSSAIAAVFATNLFGSFGLGIATGIMTFLILIFGEIVPKAYCTQHAEKVGLFAGRYVLFLEYLMLPLIYPLEILTKTIVKYASVGKKNKISKISEEEMKLMIEAGFDENIIKKKQRQVLYSAFVLDDLKVHEIMTPWKSVFALPASMPIKLAVPLLEKENYSRVPIYQGGQKRKKKIVGFVHVKDLLPLINSNEPLIKSVKKIIIAPKNMIIEDLLKKFQESQMHIAIVHDKNKKAIGIVTLEDLLEEIVGEIRDETDQKSERKRRMIHAHGNTSLEHINEVLGLNLPLKYRTISEFLNEKLKKIPDVGKEVRFNQDNIKVRILDKEGDILYKLKVSKIR